MFQKAIQTISIGFAYSTLHFDEFFDKTKDFAKINFALELM